MNISSFIVRTNKEHSSSVIENIKNSDFCEFHLNDEKGNIIVTIEGKGVDEEIAKLKLLNKIPFVINAELVYSYSQEELERERDKMEKYSEVAEWLNDDNIDAKNIRYKGDLKKRL